MDFEPAQKGAVVKVNFEDMSTRKLKRQYFKWLKVNWRRQLGAWSTSSEKVESKGNVNLIKEELKRRQWYV